MKLMSMPSKNAALAPIASIPEYAALLAEWQPARDALNALNAELREVEKRLLERQRESEAQQVDRIAARLRAGDKTGGIGESSDSLLNRATQLRLLISAQRKIDAEFRDRVREMRVDLSTTASLAVKPAHRAAVGRIVEAVEALRQAIAAEVVVRRNLAELGFDVLLPDHHVPPFKFEEHGYQTAPWEAAAKAYAQ
jgi:uncharacterized Ntn-hydrolase superfamily protein